MSLIFFITCYVLVLKKLKKGKANYVSHHALITPLVERSLRDSSLISLSKFFEFKTLQPQVNPIPKNLGNEEEIKEQSQNLTEMDKEPSPDKPIEPI